MKPRQRFRNVGAGVQAGSRLTAFTEGNDTSTPFCGPTGNSGEFLVTTSNNNSSCAQLREQYLHLLSLSNHSTTSLETTSSSSSDQATTHSLTLNSQFWSRWNISFSPVRGLVCITLQLQWRKHRSPPMCFRQNNFHLRMSPLFSRWILNECHDTLKLHIFQLLWPLEQNNQTKILDEDRKIIPFSQIRVLH